MITSHGNFYFGGESMIDKEVLIANGVSSSYADIVIKNLTEISDYYNKYSGNQIWHTASGLDYIPTKKITNLIKKFVKKTTDYQFSIMPNFDVIPDQVDKDMGVLGYVQSSDQEAENLRANAKERILKQIFKDNKFHTKLYKAALDCNIGGRIAIKLHFDRVDGLKIFFRPATEFIAIYDEDDSDKLIKIIYFNTLVNSDNKYLKRIKVQRWELINGKCILNESIFNGKANIVETLYTDYNSNLNFIPSIVVTNGGLSGEVNGESEVKDLWDNADLYNKLTSDDIDALKFQMFAETIVTDASPDSIRFLKVAPGAVHDLVSDPSSNYQAEYKKVEATYNYDSRLEHTLERIKNDLHAIAEVPRLSVDLIKGLNTSGVALKMLYGEAISKVNRKNLEWVPALELMTICIFKMLETYKISAKQLYGEDMNYIDGNIQVQIKPIFPLPENEVERVNMVLEKVAAKVQSIKSAMADLGIDNPELELARIIEEQEILDGSFKGRAMDEISNIDISNNDSTIDDEEVTE
jgi:hypothetical protein